MTAPKGRTIAWDFDATLHAYTTWTGEVPTGEPLPGAREAVQAFRDAGYRNVVFTCRALTEGGLAATRLWLDQHDFAIDEVTAWKPHAMLYVDDRAWRFEGDFTPLLAMARAGETPRPWAQAAHVPLPPVTVVDDPSGHMPWGAPMPKCGTCGVAVDEVALGRYVRCGHPIPAPSATR